LEHLLADLLNFDLSGINLHQVLRTDALFEQKVRSLDPLESWVFHCLNIGAMPRSASEWPTEILTQVMYDDYVNASEKIGVRRKLDPNVFMSKLKKLLPGCKRKRPRIHVAAENGTARPYSYQLPSRAEARAHWECMFGQKITWETPRDDDIEPPSEGFSM
jgi:hypothetical protein